MADFLGLTEEELQLFLDEMNEHLETLETDLLAIERNGADAESVARLFRAAHTIKGAAATVGLAGMTALTHAMETLFDQMRADEVAADSGTVTLLLSTVDVLGQALVCLESCQLPEDPPAEMITALGRVAGNKKALPAQLVVRMQFADSCEMPAVRAMQAVMTLKNGRMLQRSEPTEEDLRRGCSSRQLLLWLLPGATAAAAGAALARVPDVEAMQVLGAPEAALCVDINAMAAAPPESSCNGSGNGAAHARNQEDRTIRVDVAILDDLMNLVGELVIDRGRLEGIGQNLTHEAQVDNATEDLRRVTAHLARVTNSLQATVLKARMLPVERVFRKYPRMVRDLAQHMGKQVDFTIVGEETELDRSLLEVIGDPLMHCLRNALDHGLETPEERRAAGKPETCRLQLSAGYEDNQVVILVQDDGRGIDSGKVVDAAVRRGLVGAERAYELGAMEAMQLLFTPGFSTAEQVTDVSGRGVGLDVVRRNIERVGGQIEVESELGGGTTFRLLLPLTLATIQALLVKVDGDTLALPLSSVAEVFRINPEDITPVRGRWMTQLRDKIIPLLWLQQFMQSGMRPVRPDKPALTVLVNYKGELTGLVVDHLLGEQEVVVKGLGEFLGQVRGVNGVTILGDGNLALILDTVGLVSLLVAENVGIATGYREDIHARINCHTGHSVTDAARVSRG